MRSVIFLIHPENVRSRRAVEKLGAVLAGSRADGDGRNSLVHVRTIAGVHLTTPIGLVLATLALAGCGGDEGLSADSYRERAETICTDATREASGITPPSDSASSVATYSDAVGEIREHEAVALSELEPPAELEKSHTLLVNASGAVVGSLQELARAAERGDRTAATAAAASGARAAAQARRGANELGLPSCGNLGAAR